MRDRHRQEMADFMREIKQKEVTRINMIEQAPDSLAAKLKVQYDQERQRDQQRLKQLVMKHNQERANKGNIISRSNTSDILKNARLESEKHYSSNFI